eukprot:1109150-Pyramimonas_sp.AAC.1
MEAFLAAFPQRSRGAPQALQERFPVPEILFALRVTRRASLSKLFPESSLRAKLLRGAPRNS